VLQQVAQPRIAFRACGVRGWGGEELVLHPVRVLGGAAGGALAGEDGGFSRRRFFDRYVAQHDLIPWPPCQLTSPATASTSTTLPSSRTQSCSIGGTAVAGVFNRELGFDDGLNFRRHRSSG